MKILEIHYSTSWAGAERFVVDLCNELCDGDEVILCTIEDDSKPSSSYYKKDLSPKVNYINLGCNNGHQLKALWNIYKVIKSVKPDIVHAHTDLLCLFLPSLLYTKAKYFHTIHNLADKRIRYSSLKCIYYWFYLQKIFPITISNICLESYESFYALKNGVKIDNGRALLHTSNSFENVKSEIENMKLHSDDKIFVHIARCGKAKNQQLLINAFNRLLDIEEHAILIIIGAGFNDSENKYLIEKAKRGIFFIGAKDNVCDYLLYSDFFMLSSLWEGLPISLLEALSCGVIPICTPAGGIPDVIKDGKVGFVAESFEEDAFYNTIIRALKSEHTIDREFLKEYFECHFSMHCCVNEYRDYFISKLL